MKTNPKMINRLKTALKCIGTAADSVVFILLSALATSVLFRKSRYHSLIAVLFALFLSLLTVLIESRKRKRNRRMRIDKAKTEIRKEALLLLTDAEIKEITGFEDLVFIRKEQPETAEILSALSVKPKHLLCTDPNGRISFLVQRYSPETQIHAVQSLAETYLPEPSDGEAEERIRDASNARRSSVRNTTFRRVPFGRYFLLGTLLLVLSFVTDHKIYYRLLSAICMSLSVIHRFFDANGTRIFSVSFLDNIDS